MKQVLQNLRNGQTLVQEVPAPGLVAGSVLIQSRLSLISAGSERMLVEFGKGELNRHSHVLIQTFLAAHNFLYMDKTSMAVSLEVRVPYMDVELMRVCAQIPQRFKLAGNTTKYVLKKAMKRYLPREVISRAKPGFGAPLRKWVAQDMDLLLHELLGPDRVKARGLFKPQAVQEILRENRENQADHAYLIYALLTLEPWEQTFIDRPGQELAA